MRPFHELVINFGKKAKAIKQLETEFPKVIGVETVRMLKNNFKIQGYFTPGTWKERSLATDIAYEYNRTAAYRTPKLGKVSRYKNPYKGSVVHASRPILVQTGNLRDSLTYNVEGKSVTIGVFNRMVNIGGKTHNALSYAKILNEGGSHAWGKHQVSVPARKFIPKPSEGPNGIIWIMINKKYKCELNKIMNQ
jgi:phage gpG-like protein